VLLYLTMLTMALRQFTENSREKASNFLISTHLRSHDINLYHP